MIILDYSQTVIANFMAQVGNHAENLVEESLIRHMIMNSIRSIRLQFKHEFGELVIACDSKHNWRKEIFPYYKANRKKHREKSPVDWNELFLILQKVKQEIRDNFAFRVIEVSGAEADDIIATLVFNFHEREKILISSQDKDFIQLHISPNVKQWDTLNNRFIEHPDPGTFLLEHILKGDSGDGVPNYLMPDDTFINGIRQRPVTQKKLNAALEAEDLYSVFEDEERKNFIRNAKMIDLTNVPKKIAKEILEVYESEAGKNGKKMRDYFLKHDLKVLNESRSDF